MTPIYAKSLFSLMKILGWEQKAIAARLGGISDTTTSLWARGRRPLSKKYESLFHDLVGEVIAQEEARAGANSARSREIHSYLDAWAQEQHMKSESFRRTLQRQFHILDNPRARTDPARLSTRERHTLKTACLLVVHLFDFLESQGRPVPRQGAVPKTAPSVYFEELWRSYREA